LKTSNAERDLPLKVLVPPDELEEVLAFVKKAREAGGARTRLFYSRRNVKKGMKFDDVITLLQSAFRGKEGDRFRVPKFHFHLCRHAAANIWLLKLWPELHEVGTMILHNHEVPPSDSEAGVSEGKDKLPNHNQTIQWISDPGFREKLFGTRILGSDLQAIAHLLGHGSGAVTVEHYLHTLDWYQESAVRQHEPRQQGEITTTRTKPVVDVLLRLAV
jgi:integrase